MAAAMVAEGRVRKIVLTQPMREAARQQHPATGGYNGSSVCSLDDDEEVATGKLRDLDVIVQSCFSSLNLGFFLHVSDLGSKTFTVSNFRKNLIFCCQERRLVVIDDRRYHGIFDKDLEFIDTAQCHLTMLYVCGVESFFNSLSSHLWQNMLQNPVFS